MGFITVRLHKGTTLSGGAARTIIGYALRRSGRECWSAIGIDAFSGGGETLLIARPAFIVEARLADYALPLLQKYFTD